MLAFHTFLDKLCQGISEYYGDSCKVEVNKIQKNNGVFCHGISIMSGNTNISPTVYMEEMYQDYTAGKPLGEIMEKVIHIYESNKIEERIDIQFFLDFTRAGDRIVYKLINYARNRELLADVPHVRYLDMALVCYYSILHDTLGSASILIRKGNLKMWGVDEEKLFALAKENTPRILTAQIRNMDPAAEDAIDIAYRNTGEPRMYVLTNNRRQFGAVCIVYPGVLREFAQKTGRNLYILPSSVHEVILIPEREEICEAEFKEIVREVNQTRIRTEEVLADSVYYYDREKDEVIML